MKKIFILTPVYILFFLLGDIFFSNFIYKENINNNCYKYLSGFHHLKKNCHAKEKWLKNVVSYDVYTDENLLNIETSFEGSRAYAHGEKPPTTDTSGS